MNQLNDILVRSVDVFRTVSSSIHCGSVLRMLSHSPGTIFFVCLFAVLFKLKMCNFL